ncbi:hypothetical protein BpHYR1_033309 [Brachionus plicatilis]|uniref:Uncharacterized protein n=1 Tax=Brachionus plicatilis TaxID=10195 RepID=A0A3M7PD38_BRAPC|nr:hypothetical protein BpHYR1_033309 [Brachionus plicatilis]
MSKIIFFQLIGLELLQNKRPLSTFLPLSTSSNRSRSLDEQSDSDGYFIHDLQSNLDITSKSGGNFPARYIETQMPSGQNDRFYDF